MNYWSGSKLCPTEASGLGERFRVGEIKRAVFERGDDKAPGPDGFNFKFIKRFWELLEADFVDLFNEFYESGNISRGCGSSFRKALINKSLSKVVANRLKGVISSVVSCHQTGRKMYHGWTLILNEVVAWLHEEKKKRVSKIAREMKEALMRKMDIETRSVQPSVKVILLEKIHEHRNDLRNLNSELKGLGSGNTNQARVELLGSGGSNTIQLHGMKDNANGSKKNLSGMLKRTN